MTTTTTIRAFPTFPAPFDLRSYFADTIEGKDRTRRLVKTLASVASQRFNEIFYLSKAIYLRREKIASLKIFNRIYSI